MLDVGGGQFSVRDRVQRVSNVSIGGHSYASIIPSLSYSKEMTQASGFEPCQVGSR